MEIVIVAMADGRLVQQAGQVDTVVPLTANAAFKPHGYRHAC
jgi:hypothetical protein